MSIASSETRQSSITRADGISQDVSSGMKPGDRILIDGEFRYSENNKDPAIGQGMYRGTATVIVSSFGGDPPSKITFRIESLATLHPADGREITIDYDRDFGLVSMNITKELNLRKPNAPPLREAGDASRETPRRNSVSSNAASEESSLTAVSNAAAAPVKNRHNNPGQLHPMNRGAFDLLFRRRGGNTRRHRGSAKSRRARPGKKPRTSRCARPGKKGRKSRRARKSCR